MDRECIRAAIVRGMEYYLETLALPPHMEHYDDGQCAWIRPRQGAVGPACTYRVCFGEKSDAELRAMALAYREQGAPRSWLTTPFSTPARVGGLLMELGLIDPTDADLHDEGMAIPPERMSDLDFLSESGASALRVERVATPEAFVHWTRITNDVLHGMELLDPALYYPLCESGKMACFLGWDGDRPMSTAATMREDGNATLEFIATLPGARGRGFGTAVCRAALRQLVGEGAELVSLRARAMGVSLYRKLGFETYFTF